MGETIKLKASDGHELSAYRAAPSGTPCGGVVVIQEIFGVNSHIRRVADGYAQAGYLAVAPALFDRIRPGIEIGYTPDDITKGVEFKGQCTTEGALLDVAAAIGEASKAGKVGVVGYCWGGFLAFMAACRLPGIAAASSYYGGGVAGALSETPHVPTIFHFGERDKHITMDHVAQVRAAFPHLNVFVYPADHGFNCDERGSYDAPSADLARQRTLEFFADKVG